jgi:hypothetical protein
MSDGDLAQGQASGVGTVHGRCNQLAVRAILVLLAGMFPILASPVEAFGEAKFLSTLPVCPLQIETRQTVTSLDPRYTAMQSDARSLLRGAYTFVGHPREHFMLGMIEGEGRKDQTTGRTKFVWQLPSQGTEYWMECDYIGTNIMLRLPIGRGPLSCVMEAAAAKKPDLWGASIIRLECRAQPTEATPAR